MTPALQIDPDLHAMVLEHLAERRQREQETLEPLRDLLDVLRLVRQCLPGIAAEAEQPKPH